MSVFRGTGYRLAESGRPQRCCCCCCCCGMTSALSDGETIIHDDHSVDKNDHFRLGFNSKQGTSTNEQVDTAKAPRRNAETSGETTDHRDHQAPRHACHPTAASNGPSRRGQRVRKSELVGQLELENETLGVIFCNIKKSYPGRQQDNNNRADCDRPTTAVIDISARAVNACVAREGKRGRPPHHLHLSLIHI